MNENLHIQSILDLRNFDLAFRWAFPNYQKNSLTLLTHKDLCENIFFATNQTKSEAECNLIAKPSFELSKLKDEIRLVAAKCLEFHGQDILVSEKNYKLWKTLALENGQDLFITSFIGRGSSYDWPFTISMESASLDIALRNGYAENHCHFFAAGPTFAMNWIALHNGIRFDDPFISLAKKQREFKEYYSEEEFKRLENVAWLSTYLRRYLYYCYIGKTVPLEGLSLSNLNVSFENLAKQGYFYKYLLRQAISQLPVMSPLHWNDYFFDYACEASCEDSLHGERAFLYRCFEAYHGWSSINQARFFLYLLCKKYIFGFFRQKNYWFGFQNFKRFERMGELFLPDSPAVKKEMADRIHLALRQSKGIKKIEIRTAPKSNYQETYKRLQSINPFSLRRSFSKSYQSQRFDDSIPKYGVVLHFIKTPHARKNLSNIRCSPRCYSTFEQCERQAQFIKNLSLKNPWKEFPLVGVDAANIEINCRPEVFASSFRLLRNFVGMDNRGAIIHSPLKFTYHAGEDFITLSDGLRAIYEAVVYLDLKNGDRIGHASALGTKLDFYFSLKGRKLTQTRQDALDDLCFIFLMIRNLESFAGKLGWLKERISELLLAVYGSNNVESYLRSLSLRADHPEVHFVQNAAGDYRNVALRFLADGKKHYLREDGDDSYDNAWLDGEALRFVHQYHYSKFVREKGEETVECKLNDLYMTSLEAAQKQLVHYLLERNVGIETNPTSNYLIGPYSDFEDIPCLTMLGIEPSQEHYRDLLLSLGTDDPGVFGTNLRNEYASILFALKESNLVQGDSLIRRIESLAESSMYLSFVK